MSLDAVRQAQRLLDQAREGAANWRENLRDEVEEAREEGHTLAEIGSVLGMTRQGVYDLLKR